MEDGDEGKKEGPRGSYKVEYDGQKAQKYYSSVSLHECVLVCCLGLAREGRRLQRFCVSSGRSKSCDTTRMVLLLLKIKADLENITNLVPAGGSDGTEFTYYFKVKCGSCGNVNEKDSTVTASEQYPIPKSRGQAHLVQKCKLCENVGNISLVEGRGKPYNIEDSEAGNFVPVACFDCRGMEPVEFSLRDGWSAEGLTGTKFENIDLSDGEWSEYDERASASVGILNIEHRFDNAK